MFNIALKKRFAIPGYKVNHGNSLELCKSCIDSGFSSVMYDTSKLKYDDNVKFTKQVVSYAHKKDISVEAKLGIISGIEDHIKSDK